MPAFEIVHVEEQTALVRRARCLPKEVGPTIMRLFQDTISGNPDAVAIAPPMIKYLAWHETDCEIESAMPVEPGTLARGGNELKTYPATTAVRAIHVGPYEELPLAWSRLWEAVLREGVLCATPAWDAYVTDPAEEPNPSKWITELYIPLQKFV